MLACSVEVAFHLLLGLHLLVPETTLDGLIPFTLGASFADPLEYTRK